MKPVETFLLRGLAAQRDVIQLNSFSTAFLGAAMMQAMLLGLQAPHRFWLALGRAGERRALAAPPLQLPSPRPAMPRLAAPPVAGSGDDLTQLVGINPALAQSLKDCGITRFDQIANLDTDAVNRINSQHRGFRRLCHHHDLIGQAKARLAPSRAS